jgi:ABC-2 type transport system ATP-binding protein
VGAAIEAQDLHKSYGSFEAVRGISFAVAAGESVAFLGPNGAGKTTTVEILEGYRSPSSGCVRVLGLDPVGSGAELRRRIGIVLQTAGFPPELTVAELIDAWRRFYPDPLPLGEVLDAVGLGDRRHVRAKNLSGGEHRRLDLALGLVGRPEVLFLDEPTTGFDPSARRAAWDLIEGLVGRGMTLFLTTHYLEEAQALADRIIIISEGRIAAEGAPDDIGGRGQAPGTVTFVLPAGLAPADLPALPAGATLAVDGHAVRITTTELIRASHAVTGWALGRGLDLRGFRVDRPTLEETYLAIIGGAGVLLDDEETVA